MPLPHLNDAFQLAYVTNDLERSAALLQERFGTGPVSIFRDMPGAVMNLGLCFAGNTNYELIEPHNKSGDMYSDWIADAEGFCHRFHHFGFNLPDLATFEALRAEHKARNYNMPLDVVVPDSIHVFYSDVRHELGHYLEYFYMLDGSKAMFAQVAGSTIR
ncbi:MAG TPA: VOC family protein [Novosphingobium sp.]